MNGELTKNAFGPATPYTPEDTNTSFGDADFLNTSNDANTPENDPMQLSFFGEGTPQGDIVLSGSINPYEKGNEENCIAGVLPEPSDKNKTIDKKLAQSRRRKKSAATLAAFFCLSSVAAYICAGFFVADTVMERGFSLFENELMAASPALKDNSVDTTPVIPAVRPSESVPPDTDVPTPPSIPEYPVEGVSMATHDPFAIANETKYTPDIAALTSAEAFAASRPDIVATDAEPLVLVVHTHATEAFLSEGLTSYNDDTTFRSTDSTQNMIAVGDELCRALGEAGIEALHCTEMFDSESFIKSYEKSAAAVGEYLRAYPSIRYVLDVHRDAIFRQDGTLLAARTADGSAQVMLVCGTDEMGAVFPDWQDNLAFAFSLQAAAKSLYPDMMRNVNLRGASFNEQLAERFLLVEIGSAGNTLAEAKSAARRFGEVFTSVIKG